MVNKKPAFQSANELPTRRRLIIAIDGPDKTGKTWIGLSAPGPVYVHSFDVGLEGVVEKWRNKKDIQVADYRDNVSLNPDNKEGESAKDWWEQFVADYVDGSVPNARSCVWDTASEVWELERLAFLGKLTQIPPIKYTEVNMLYRKLLRIAYDSDMNLILLHKVKDEYSGNNKTGNAVRSGFSETGHLVQVNGHTYRSSCSCKKTHSGPCQKAQGDDVPATCNCASPCGADDKFHFVFDNCRLDPSLNGHDITFGESGLSLTPFQEIAMMIHPDSDLSEWA